MSELEAYSFLFSKRERELLLKTVEWIADLLPEVIEDGGYSGKEQELHIEMLTFCKDMARRLKEEKVG